MGTVLVGGLYRGDCERIVGEGETGRGWSGRAAREAISKRDAASTARRGPAPARVRRAGRAGRRRGPPRAGVSMGAERVQLPFLAVVSTNQFKNGNHIEVDGTIFKIARVPARQARQGRRVRAHEAAPGRPTARSSTGPSGPGRSSGRCAPRRARCSSSTPTAPTRTSWTRSPTSRSRSPRRRWPRPLRWIAAQRRASTCCSSTTRPSDMQLPSAVDLEVTDTEPGVRGDTASGGGNKPATLETGAIVAGPAVREHRRPRAGRHPLRRVRLARVADAPHRAAPRRGLRALPARR